MAAEDAVLRTLSPRIVRGLSIAVFVAGLAGVIGGSIADDNGIAITFGLLAAGAAIVLMAVTAVTGGAGRVDERAAEELEAKVQALVDAGADESTVRDLVRAAVRLGRGRR